MSRKGLPQMSSKRQAAGLAGGVGLSESADQYHRHGGRHLYPESLSSGGFPKTDQ